MADLPNIGPTVAARLREVGIARRSELERLGAVEAYRRLREGWGQPPPLRHDLFGLDAALTGIGVSDLPRARRTVLMRAALDLPESALAYPVRSRGFVPGRWDGRRRQR